jgi:hypothetical protein
MAGKIVAEVPQATINSAASTGTLTVTSTTGYYPKATVWLRNTSSGVSQEGEIVSVVNSTTLAIRIKPIVGTHDGHPNYGTSDLSAYNANSNITMPQQFIYNSNDLGLS